MTSDPAARPNVTIGYADATTGALIKQADFHDPFLGWRESKKGLGDWRLCLSYGGEPMAWWLAENPRP